MVYSRNISQLGPRKCDSSQESRFVFQSIRFWYDAALSMQMR